MIVIIPAFNAVQLIGRSIESLLPFNQDCGIEIEVIVVDDASTDGTAEVAAKYPVSVYSLSENVGCYQAINEGLKIASNSEWDFFTISGADDISSANRLNLCMGAINGKMVATGASRRVDLASGKEVRKRAVNESLCLFRRGVFDRIGYFDPVRFGGDTEYFERFLRFFGEGELGLVPHTLSTGFEHGTNLTNKNPISSPERIKYKNEFQARHKRILTANRVLVIMSVWNGAATLEAAVLSVLNQSHRSLTLAIVDDCSTDHSLALATDLARLNSRVMVLPMLKNAGAYACRNEALKQLAAWDFFTICDADDFMHPGCIENRLRAIETAPGTMVASGSKYRRLERKSGQEITPPKYGDGMVLFSREAFDRCGFFLKDRYGADSEYFKRVRLAFPGRVISADKLDYTAYQDGENLSAQISGGEIQTILSRHEDLHTVMAKENDFYLNY